MVFGDVSNLVSTIAGIIAIIAAAIALPKWIKAKKKSVVYFLEYSKVFLLLNDFIIESMPAALNAVKASFNLLNFIPAAVTNTTGLFLCIYF